MSLVRIKKTNEFFALSPDGRRHRIQEFRTITRATAAGDELNPTVLGMPKYQHENAGAMIQITDDIFEIARTGERVMRIR